MAKKAKLRDLMRAAPTIEERNAMSQAFIKELSPIAIAILGLSELEYNLECLVRLKIKRNDDGTWTKITDIDGPIHSYNAKVQLAYALGMIDENMRHNLLIVGRIRNAFAHSRKLIHFDDPLVLKELKSVKLPRAKSSPHYKILNGVKTDSNPGRHKYIMLCLRLGTELLRRITRGYSAAKRNRMRKDRAKSGISSLFLGYGQSGGLGTFDYELGPGLLSSYREESAKKN